MDSLTQQVSSLTAEVNTLKEKPSKNSHNSNLIYPQLHSKSPSIKPK
jgi:hypothetical protein